MNKKISIGSAIALVLLAVVTTWCITYFAASDFFDRRLGEIGALESQYKKFKELSDVVEKYYIDEFDEQALMDGAMRGYVDALGDVWSSYFTAEEYARILEEEEATYFGIGVELSYEEGGPYTITYVYEGSPAEQAGVQMFDIITQVGGVPVEEFGSVNDLISAVKGERGTAVKMTLLRGEQSMTLDILRDEIVKQNIRAEMLPGDIGYVHILGFNEGDNTQFDKKVNELVAEGAKALVFDVRFNPGGSVSVLWSMLDKLLPEGMVISLAGKDGQSLREYKSDENCLKLPMAVLVNEYSVSAAEFFAAALQEYGVAEIVGDHTTGKGFAQQMIELDDGSAVNISIARYYTPQGNNLAGVGVAPNHEISLNEQAMRSFNTLAPEDDAQLQKAVEILSAKVE